MCTGFSEGFFFSKRILKVSERIATHENLDPGLRWAIWDRLNARQSAAASEVSRNFHAASRNRLTDLGRELSGGLDPEAWNRMKGYADRFSAHASAAVRDLIQRFIEASTHVDCSVWCVCPRRWFEVQRTGMKYEGTPYQQNLLTPYVREPKKHMQPYPSLRQNIFL